jgi:hypothetical protein
MSFDMYFARARAASRRLIAGGLHDSAQEEGPVHDLGAGALRDRRDLAVRQYENGLT